MDGGRKSWEDEGVLDFFSLIEAAVECEMERLLWANWPQHVVNIEHLAPF